MKGKYWFTRFIFLRALGFIYLIAFAVAAQQYVPLLGSRGIFPVGHFLELAKSYYGSTFFWKLPTLLWINSSDIFIQVLIYVGLALALLVLLGFADSLILFALWALYLSLIHGGQLFYGYGWETMVVETGFLAVFWAAPLNPKPFPAKSPPSPVLVWLIRWLLFRVMFGAALIKLRGDPCWRDLTCLDYHFETQPLPNPLSWYFHHLPHWALMGGVLFNHLAEVIAPWMIFGPRRIRHWGAGIIIAFQMALILSGNLSWLNYLTIFLCISCFDDQSWKFLFPASWKTKITTLSQTSSLSPLRRGVTYALAGLIVLLSIRPALNLISPNQAMNASFEPFFLVNTYGAFGSVTKERNEIILEGTSEANPGPTTEWRPYEFKCKPGDIHRRPCVVSPFHYRLDWQMWFAAMSNYRASPWLLKLIEEMLQGNPGILSLLDNNPFPSHPPALIRATLYRYHFTDWRDPTHAWWRREKLGTYLPPLKLENGELAPYSRP